MRQITDTLLMVRPVRFRKNEETAVNNYFQEDIAEGKDLINTKAQAEFDGFVQTLRTAGVQVVVIDDILENDTPDSIFPNNWVSFHDNGVVGFYPMFAENRRRERRVDVLEILEDQDFEIHSIEDYTEAEEEGVFLEGTGSVILDRVSRKAYCALSPRADEDLFIEFCEDFEYTPIVFTANQTVGGKRLPIYHTNVMMCIGEQFCVICTDAIDDVKEQKNVLKNLKADGKEIIKITEAQMHQFAGNMLQVKNSDGAPFVVMSSAAHQSLTQYQIQQLEKYCPILSSPLDTIETCGGGSARCMMAEVFLPKNK